MNKINSVFIILVILLSLILLLSYNKNETKKVEPVEKEEQYSLKKESTYDDALNSITKSELKDILYYIASDELEGRMSGKVGNKKAAEYIKNKYESFGLPTEYDKFNIKKGINPGPHHEIGDGYTQNVYAWIEGKSDEVIVIGAHFDHVGYGPTMSGSRQIAIHNGADDNGSGTTCLLEIAEAFSKIKEKVNKTIVFQSYSAEEMGLIGSKHYCNNPKFPKNKPDIKKHILMINLDMVGHLKEGKIRESTKSDPLSQLVNRLNRKYNVNVVSANDVGDGSSDYASFYNKGVPIISMFTGLHDYYHTPEDDPFRINYDGMEKLAKYAFEAAFAVDQDEIKPELNVVLPLPIKKDHDKIEFPQ